MIIHPFFPQTLVFDVSSVPGSECRKKQEQDPFPWEVTPVGTQSFRVRAGQEMTKGRDSRGVPDPAWTEKWEVVRRNFLKDTGDWTGRESILTEGTASAKAWRPVSVKEGRHLV